jgi:hypothetical protein
VDMVRESGESPMWYAPVPQESMVCMRGCAGKVRDWKTPSAIVDRPGLLVCRGRGEGKSGVQMFPKQTKRTETGLGGFESLIVLVGRWFRCRCVEVLAELFGDAPGRVRLQIDRYATSLSFDSGVGTANTANTAIMRRVDGVSV